MKPHSFPVYTCVTSPACCIVLAWLSQVLKGLSNEQANGHTQMPPGDGQRESRSGEARGGGVGGDGGKQRFLKAPLAPWEFR